MTRPCSVCGHPRRAEIDVALQGGASLDDVVAAFGLPSRSALQRHRAGHLGRAVTFRLPAASAPPQGSAPEQLGGEIDTAAELDRLFARAAGSSRSLQDYAAVVTDGLAHVYAAAVATGDLSVAVRALREMRGLLQFHALVDPERLRQHPGWREPEVPCDPIFAMHRLLAAQLVEDAAEINAARHELDTARPGFGTALSEIAGPN